MKIITLIENLVTSPELLAEHGLSIFIDSGDKKLLFDTGQSGLFMQNAQKLGVDIGEIDAVIISHGHYDHTGGLYAFLQANNKAKVYAKSGIFVPKYNGKTRFIGTPENVDLFSGRLNFVDQITEIVPNIFIMPDTEIYHEIDTNFTRLYKKEGISFLDDTFEDELFLVIKADEHINIITACSHRGITNICSTATSFFKQPVNLILGGFHMKDCGIEQYVHITHYLQELQPQLLGTCHCTGVEKFSSLLNEADCKVFYNATGNKVEIP